MTRSMASNQWQDPASDLPRGQTALRVMAARVPEHPGLPLGHAPADRHGEGALGRHTASDHTSHSPKRQNVSFTLCEESLSLRRLSWRPPVASAGSVPGICVPRVPGGSPGHGTRHLPAQGDFDGGGEA